MQVGRWLGYTTALIFAMVSLYRIISTFKRVLWYTVHKKLNDEGRLEMVKSLANRHTDVSQQMARVLTMLPRCDSGPADDVGPFGDQQNRLASRRVSAPVLPAPDGSHVHSDNAIGAAHQHGVHCCPGNDHTNGVKPGAECSSKDVHQDGVLSQPPAPAAQHYHSHHQDSMCANIMADIQRLEVCGMAEK